MSLFRLVSCHPGSDVPELHHPPYVRSMRWLSARMRRQHGYAFGVLVGWVLTASSPAQEPWVDSLKRELRGTHDATARLHLLNSIAGSNDDATSETYSRATMTLADSLLANGHPADTTVLRDKVGALLNLSYYLSLYGQQDSAIAFCQHALGIGERIGDKGLIANAERMMAVPLGRAGRIDEAIEHGMHAIGLQEELKDTLGIAKSSVALGLLYRQTGNDPVALDWFMRAQRSFEQLHDDNNTAIALVNIANVQLNFGEGDSALAVYAQALMKYRKVGNAWGMAQTYSNMAQTRSELQRYDEALKDCADGLAIAEPANDRYNMGALYRDIGLVRERQGRYEDALTGYAKAMRIIREVNDPGNLVSTLTGMARSHLALGHVKEALSAALEAEHNMATAQPLGRSEVMSVLSAIYARTGDKDRELSYYRRYIALQDTVKNEENSRKVMQTFFRAEYDKRTAALKEEQQRKEALAQAELDKQKLMRNAYAVAGVLLLALVFLLFYRYRLKRRAHRELEGENRMISEEKERSDELLLNILPGDVADELKAKGEAQARDIDEVSILFTDFKGFTAMGEQLTAQELVAEINVCFKAFDGIIGRHGVEKIKTIGDAYMAAGGLTAGSANAARGTVSAALEMQEFMHRYKAQRDALGQPAFEMRVGIHTGPVVAGIVGVKKFAYDIWGDTVNIASRMESSGAVGEVNISESTYMLVKTAPGLSFTSRGKVEAKGKGAMEMFFVHRTNGDV
jgi:adenylate cyclase